VKNTQEGIRGKSRVAVVTPVVGLPLSADEQISLRHLREHLGQFDRYIIGQQSLPKELSDFALHKFPVRDFVGLYSYNRLMMTEEFYRAFEEYEYILIYQLDCLVFDGNLEEWCRREWDYVGAPWLKDRANPTLGFSGVGNGGLSLRRVKSALAVLRSNHLVEDPKLRGSEPGPRSKYIFDGLRSAPRLKRGFTAAKTLLHRVGYHNNVRWLARQLADNQYKEDYFWAFQAPKFVTSFRIPEPFEALEFSFEMAPRYCFEKNSSRLPFGCHAWAKYDRGFWEPFLRSSGDNGGSKR
jgi:hypothetical protein